MMTILNSYQRSYRWNHIGTTIIVLLGFALRIFRLAEQSYWWDELTTVGRSVIYMGDMFSNLLNNRTHVPLYFMLMQGWTVMGSGEFIIRFFSVICGVLSIALIYRTGGLLGGRSVGLVAALFLAFSPFNIWYSQEARMYALVAFTVLAAHWFLIRILKGGNRINWIGYFLTMLVSVYTHYLAIFILIGHYAFFSIHHRYNKQYFRTWLFYGGGVAILFSIWIGVIFLNGGFSQAPIGWISAANWYEPFLTFVSLSIGPSIEPQNPVFYVVPLTFLIVIVVGLHNYFRLPTTQENNKMGKQRTFLLRLVLIWFLIPILLAYLISLDYPIPRKRSLYMDRYLIICLPSLILLGAWGLDSTARKLNNGWLVYLGTLLVIGISSVTLQNMYFNPDFSRDNWRGALDTMAERWEDEDVYLVKPSQMIVIYQYGSDFMTAEFIPYFFQPQTRDNYDDDDIRNWVQSAIEESERAWLITAVENVNPHGFPQSRTAALQGNSVAGPMEKWMDRYCPDPDQWRFTGILLSRYDLAGCLFPTS